MAIMASEAPRRRYISFLGLAYAALLLAASAAPASAQLLNDANDAADFSDFTSRAVPRAVGFVQAATCCSGCSYYSPCCCAPGGIVVTATVTRQAARKAVPTTKRRARLGGVVGRELEVEAAEDDEVSPNTERALFARNLCPACPAGASVSPGPGSSGQRHGTTGSTGSGVSYCCQGKRTVTVTVTAVGPGPKPGPTNRPGPPPPPSPPGKKALIQGRLWFDNNKDGKFTPGIDKLITNRWVLIRRKDGTVIGRVKTDNTGRFSVQTPVYANEKMSVALLSAPTSPVGTFQTGRDGNAIKNVPIPPAKIQGNLWYDTKKDGKLDSRDKPIANQWVEIRFANGTLWRRVKTNAKGHFEFEAPRYPYEKLVMYTMGGKVVKTFRADGNGNGRIDIPLTSAPAPPAPPAAINGVVYWDLNKNNKKDPKEPAATSRFVEIRFPNGTLLTVVKTDPSGRFNIDLIGIPNQLFQIIDPKTHEVMQTFKTNALGSGSSETPLTPAIINGTAWIDKNNNGARDPDEPAMANTFVDIRRPDGSLVDRVPTGPDGSFSFPTVPDPGAEFHIIGPDGTMLDKFTTDADGNAQVPVSIPTGPGTARIVGDVFYDTNDDGSRGPEDKPYAGKPIEIKWPNGTILKTVFTDSAGSFDFSVPQYPGVEFTAYTKDGLAVNTFTTDGSGNGQVSIPIAPADIQGTAWIDLNKDGEQDSDEPPLGNKFVDIKFLNGSLFARVATNSTGGFDLPVLPYPNQALAVYGPDGVLLKQFNTDAKGNAVVIAQRRPALIDGTVWYDANKDGIQGPDEKPLANSFVKILWPNGTLFAEVPTNSTGGFAYPTAPYPNQLFTVVGPDGVVYKSFRTGPTGDVTVPSVIPQAKIQGNAYLDTNGNGIQDSSERPLSNSYVDLKWPNGTVFARVPTNATGGFDLPTSAYPNQLFNVFGPDGQLVKTFKTDSNGNAVVPVIAVPQAEIQGMVWYDANKDGIQQPSELPLSNSHVDIKWPNGTLFARVPTNSTGGFDYPTTPYPNQAFNVFGPDGAFFKTFSTDSKGNAVVPLPLPKSVIDGTAWLDVNKEGNQDPNESPLNNSFVTIAFPNGTVIGTVPTNSTGGFRLPVNTYPNEPLVVLGPDSTVLKNFQTDSNGDASVPIPVTPAHIVANVFYDANNDGARDPTESPYANKPVEIRWPNGTLLTTVMTNASGGFDLPVYPYPGVTFNAMKPGGAVIATFTTDSSGNGQVLYPIPAADIQGTAWTDLDRDGVQDPNEPTLANSFVDIKWPNGTLLARVPTNATGGFDTPVVPYSNQPFTIFTPDGTPITTFSTDSKGDAVVPVSIPPADIQGTLWFDANKDGIQQPNEAPLANSFVDIMWPNGTLLARVPTNSTSGFSLPTVAYPNQTFLLVAPDGTVFRNFTTDSLGDATVPVPLPQPKIVGTIWWDRGQQDGALNTTSGDKPLPKEPLLLLMPNGSVYANVTTLPNGTFMLDPKVPMPNTQFVVVRASDPTTPVGTFTTDGLGNGQIDIPLLPAEFQGTTWIDLNKDGIQDPNEPVLNNSYVEVRWPNGTLFTKIPTNETGGFDVSVLPFPNQNFTVNLPGGQPIGTFTTDENGDATNIPIPVPPSIITGKVYFDFANGTDPNAVSDVPWANKPVQLRFPNGTVYANVTLDANGEFVLQPDVPAPLTTLSIVDPVTGKVYGKLPLDSAGSGNVTVPISPVEVQGTVWYDTNRDGIQQPGERPLNNSFVQILWPNGSLFAEVPTNATGGFDYPTIPYPNQTFTIVSPDGVVLKNFTTKSDGSAMVLVPIPPPRISGSIWWDLDESNTLKAGDKPLPGEPLLLIAPDGTVYANITTKPDGSFVFDPTKAMPNATFTVVRASNPTAVVGTFTTDLLGNGRVDMPLPPADIQGTAWIDLNKDGIQDPNEPVLNNSYVDVKWPNGTLFARVPTNETGGFDLSTIPYPNQTFAIFSPGGIPIETFTTDPAGDATTAVSISPPLITGKVWFEFTNDTTFSSGTDQPLEGKVLQLKFPNGTVYSTVTLDANGEFSLLPDIAKTFPNGTLSVVDPSTGKVVGKIPLDGTGSGNVDIPIPPVAIQGTVWYDANKDGIQQPNEQPLNNSVVTIAFTNGTVVAEVPTNATGGFVYPTIPYPNETFVILSPEGAVLDTFTTKPDGSVTVLPVPISPPQIVGTIWWNLNADQNLTAGDKPLPKEPLVLLLPDGTVYANVTTLPNGTFFLDPKIPLPNTPLTVVRASDLTTPLATFTTDPLGNGKVNIPLPPADIQGTAWVDLNKDGIQDPNEPPLNNSFIDIKWPNGTLLARVPTNETGGFDLPTVPYPNENFTVFLPNGAPLSTFTTDSNGDASVPVLVPPSLITGKIWFDPDNNTLFDALTDQPLQKTYNIIFPNGTIYQTVTTDANGDFMFIPPIAAPGMNLTVIDPTNPLQPMGTIPLDSYGSGHVDIPIPPPPPLIVAQICFDMNTDGTCSETPYSNKPVQLLFPNGTVYMTGTVAPNGTLILPVSNAAPGTTFNVVSPLDPSKPLGQITTNNLGTAETVIPIPPPKIVGTMWWDLDKDKNLTAGVVPIPGEPLLLVFPNGTIYGNVTTNPDGTFEFDPSIPMPNATLNVVRASSPKIPLVTIVTDPLGNGEALIPIPPADVQGVACLDLNKNGVCGSGDVPLNNTMLQVLWPNGTVYAQVPTNSTGGFDLPMVPLPNQTFILAGPDGTPLQTFSTGPTGTANVLAAVPSATIAGDIWYDMNSNLLHNANDTGYINKPVEIYWPNGTLFQTVMTNATGGFSIPVYPYPNTTFTMRTPDGVVVSQLTTDASGNGKVSYPIPPAAIQGTVWQDLDGDGIQDPNEPLLNNSFVDIKWPNGTLLARVPTNSTGGFDLPVVPYPNQNFTVFGPDGKPIETFTTTPAGNAVVLASIPSAVISGTMWFDHNNDTSLDGGDNPYANTTLQIKFPNGTVYTTVQTDENGNFQFLPKVAAPGMNLTVVDPKNPTKVLGVIPLDSTGSGHVDIPITPPVIDGKIYYDFNRNNVSGPGDLPYKEQIIQLLYPNGTVYMQTTVGPDGNYSFPVTNPEPGVIFTIVPQSDPTFVLGTVGTNTLGGGHQDVPLAAPKIITTIWWDLNKDGNLTSTDSPFYKEPIVLLLPDGTIYANLTTLPNGTVVYDPKVPMPNTVLTVARASDLSTPLGTFTTDPLGNGKIDIPLPPANIGGVAWVDLNKDGIQDPNEPMLNNSYVDIRWPNGTLLERVPTDANGNWNTSVISYPEQNFTVYSPGGVPVTTITTDPNGNANNIPTSIPQPVITGKIWFDINNDTSFTDGSSTDVPWADKVFQLKLPNGTVYANVTLDANGEFVYAPGVENAAPSALLSIVDPATNKVYGTLQLDPTGSGDKQIPIPPAVIQGSAFYDLDNDGIKDPNEVPLNNSYVDVFWPNGTLFERIPTNETGAYSIPTIPYPNQQFEVVLPNGVPLKNFTTNAQGNAVVQDAIPPPEISLKIWYDYNNDSLYNGIDKHVQNLVLNMYLPNGTLYAQQVTKPDGTFDFIQYTDIQPNVKLTVIDPTSNNLLGTIQLDQFGSGHVDIPLPPPKPVASAIICFDMLTNNNCTSGDTPYKSEPVVLKLPNGTIVGTGTIGPDGNVTFPLDSRFPNTQMSICLASAQTSCIGSLTTDPYGDASKIIPLSPPVITGNLWYDVVNDTKKNTSSGDVPLSEPLLLVLPNGTIYANVTTLSNGAFKLDPSIPLPSENLTVYRNSDPTVPVGSFITDPLGNGNIDIPIPPSSIDFAIWVDANGDGFRDPSEYPFKARPITIRFKNGTALAGAVSNEQGTGSVLMPGVFPNEEFEVLDVDGTVISKFVTDEYGGASVPIPIPVPAESPGQSATFGANGTDTVCSNTPYDVVVGSLIEPGKTMRSIEVDFTSGTNYTAGSAKAPSGWILEFSKDGGKTWSTTEPSPASLVTNIRTYSPNETAGGVWVNSTGNTAQEFTSSTSADMAAGTIQSATAGGDAFDLIFANKIDRLFFAWHHQTGFLPLECRILSTGLACPGYNPNNYITSNVAAKSRIAGYSTSSLITGYYHPKDGRLYMGVGYMAGSSTTGYPAVVCIDVGAGNVPPKLCPTPHYIVDTTVVAVPDGNMFINQGAYMPSVDRFYFHTFRNLRLQCWDWTTKATCLGYPKTLQGTADGYRQFVWKGDKYRLFHKTDTTLYCIDVRTDQPCSSGYPHTLGTGVTAGLPYLTTTWAPVNHMSVKYGPIDGACFYWGCIDFNGTLRNDWVSPANPYRAGFLRSGWNTWVNWLPNYFVTTPLAQSWFFDPYCPGCYYPTYYTCWDWTTQALCANVTRYVANDDEAYVGRLNPTNPFCYYFDHNSGLMGAFDVLTGKAGCPSSSMDEATLVEHPEDSCSGRPVLIQRLDITAAQVRNGTVASLILSVYQADGTPVDGWIGIDMNVGVPVDLRGLTMEMTGTNPKYSIAYVRATGNPSIYVELRYVGPGPELCFKAQSTTSSTGAASNPFVASINHNTTGAATVGFNSTVNVVPC